ncbi:MAG: hypothetical protein IPM91_08380 [Bacteroidetes bacterium]|nr:hypothetical protein [Bacteroidota bacterium]
MLECCSISSGAISLIPQQFGTRYISHETVLQSTIFGVCSTCVINAPGEITLDGSFTNEDIFIDGEFVLRSGTANPNNYILKNWTIHLGDNASLSIDPDRKLTLENCTLVSCGNKMWNSII